MLRYIILKMGPFVFTSLESACAPRIFQLDISGMGERDEALAAHLGGLKSCCDLVTWQETYMMATKHLLSLSWTCNTNRAVGQPWTLQ